MKWVIPSLRWTSFATPAANKFARSGSVGDVEKSPVSEFDGPSGKMPFSARRMVVGTLISSYLLRLNQKCPLTKFVCVTSITHKKRKPLMSLQNQHRLQLQAQVDTLNRNEFLPQHSLTALSNNRIGFK